MVNVIAFLKSASPGRGGTQVADDNPLPVVQAAPPVGGGVTYTDRTKTSLSGSSETLVAANAARRSLLIKNGASAVAIGLTGATAAIGGAGSLTLQPYEGLHLSGADCPVGAITVIGTASAYCNAYEGT